MIRILAVVPAVLMLGPVGCVEWVSTREGPEAIPLATARRICDDYADRQIERDRPLGQAWPSGRRSDADRSRYSYYFNRCMRGQGWELQRKQESTEEDAPSEASP